MPTLPLFVHERLSPRAWHSIKKALKRTHDPEVWDHLAGTTSAPFEAGEHGQTAVKVSGDPGNELLVAKNLKVADARGGNSAT